MRKLRNNELGRLTPEEFAQAGKTPMVLILDNIRSMHNVGSMFRTADCFLAEHIYLCGMTPEPGHHEIEKTALGATQTVAWTQGRRYPVVHSIFKRARLSNRSLRTGRGQHRFEKLPSTRPYGLGGWSRSDGCTASGGRCM